MPPPNQVALLHDFDPALITGVSNGGGVATIPDGGSLNSSLNSHPNSAQGTFVASGANGKPGVKIPFEIGGTFDTLAYHGTVSLQIHSLITIVVIADFQTSHDNSNPSPHFQLFYSDDATGVHSQADIRYRVATGFLWAQWAWSDFDFSYPTNFNIIEEPVSDTPGVSMMAAQLHSGGDGLTAHFDCEDAQETGSHAGVRWDTIWVGHQLWADWTVYRLMVWAGTEPIDGIRLWASQTFGIAMPCVSLEASPPPLRLQAVSNKPTSRQYSIRIPRSAGTYL